MIYFAQTKHKGMWIDMNISSTSLEELNSQINAYFMKQGISEYRIVQKSETATAKGKKTAGCC